MPSQEPVLLFHFEFGAFFPPVVTFVAQGKGQGREYTLAGHLLRLIVVYTFACVTFRLNQHRCHLSDAESETWKEDFPRPLDKAHTHPGSFTAESSM